MLCWSVCLHTVRPGVIRGEANWGPSSAHTGSHTEHECKHNSLHLKLFEFELEGLMLTLCVCVRERGGVERDRETIKLTAATGESAPVWRIWRNCKKVCVARDVIANLFYSLCLSFYPLNLTTDNFSSIILTTEKRNLLIGLKVVDHLLIFYAMKHMGQWITNGEMINKFSFRNYVMSELKAQQIFIF